MASTKSVVALIKALRPAFRSGNDNDKAALAVHAYFLASGYDLVATGPRAFSPSALTSASTDDVGIERWNEIEDQYAFVYVNPGEGSKKVLVKCLVMEDKLHVYCALADGSSKHVELDHKRKQLNTLWEENKISSDATNMVNAASVKNVYSTRQVKQKIGSGSDEAVGLGILLEDPAIHETKPHDIPKTSPNIPIPNAQLTTASAEAGAVPVTQEFHLLSDQILPTPIKKMSPHHLQDGEVY